LEKIAIEPGNIAHNLGDDAKEDEQGEHHQGRLAQDKGEH
jgi:hypothetical protein